MATYTCKGCKPIDASIIDAYVALIGATENANNSAANAEEATTAANNAATSAGNAAEQATNAALSANAAAAAANAAGITQAEASVDSNTGTPSVDVSLVNKKLSLSFHNIKGEKGEKGDRGDGAVLVINDLVTGGTDAALSAEMGKTLNTSKQATLVSGTNIKTVNGESLLGEGNIIAGDPNAVKYVEQTLTDAQKTQARTNIDAYQKPSTGIPATDLTSTAQASLGKADTAYQKPSSGIPKTELETGVQGSLDLADSAIQARPAGEVDPTITPADYATTEELGELEAKVTELDFNLGESSQRIQMASGYIVCNGAVGTVVNLTPVSHATYKNAVVSCQQGTVFYIQGKGGNSDRLYCFIDAEDKVISSAPSATTFSDPVRIVAPANSAKVIINDETGSGISYKGETTDERIEAKVDDLDESIGDWEYTNVYYGVDDVTWENGGIKGSDGTNMTTSSSMKRTNYIDVSGLESITFMGTQSNTAGETYGYAFYDNSQVYVSGSRWDEDTTAPAEIKKVYTVPVPPTAKYFRTCRYVPIVGNDWYLESIIGKTITEEIEQIKQDIETEGDNITLLNGRVDEIEEEIDNIKNTSLFNHGPYITYKCDLSGWYENQETEFSEGFSTWNSDNTQYPPTYATLISLYDGFVTGNPGRITKYDLGAASGTDAYGNTYHLYEYRIVPKTTTHENNNRKTPKILIDATMHGTERNCAFGLYYFIKDLLYNYDKNPILGYIRTFVEIRFIPISNPWGFEHNKYVNANGVNLNRNFPTEGWEVVTTPPDQATGDAPLDQPEAAILDAWLKANKDTMLIHLNLHTNGARTVLQNFENCNCLMPISTCPDSYFNRVFPAIQKQIQFQTLMFQKEYNNIRPNYNDLIGRCQTDSNHPGTIDEYAVLTLNIVSMTHETFGGIKDDNNEEVVVGGSTQSQKMCAEMIGNFIARVLQEFSE